MLCANLLSLNIPKRITLITFWHDDDYALSGLHDHYCGRGRIFYVVPFIGIHYDIDQAFPFHIEIHLFR
jgi:hypothetical protein